MYLVPCGRGHTAAIVAVAIIVTNVAPLLCIAQGLFAYPKPMLRCLDIEPVLFQLLQAFLPLMFLILSCNPCHLRLEYLLLLMSEGLRSIGHALACQCLLHLGDRAHAQFSSNAKDIGVGWLRGHCATQLTLADCKLRMGIGTGINIPRGCPCARTNHVQHLRHTDHLVMMGEAVSDSGQTGQ